MPMMNELIEQLNQNPPQNERELEDLLADTGYALEVTREGDDSEMDEEYGESEEMEMSEEGEEAEEDMGPKDSAVELDIIKEMMPMGAAMGDMPPGMNPRMMMQVKTRKAAKNALKGDE